MTKFVVFRNNLVLTFPTYVGLCVTEAEVERIQRQREVRDFLNEVIEQVVVLVDQEEGNPAGASGGKEEGAVGGVEESVKTSPGGAGDKDVS